MKRDSANLKTLLTVLSVSFIALTILIGVFAYFFFQTPFTKNLTKPDKSSSAAQSQSVSSSSEASSEEMSSEAGSSESVSSEEGASLPPLEEVVSSEAPPEPPAEPSPPADTPAQPVSFHVPDKLHGVMLSAGSDYLTNPSASAAAVKAEMDKALQDAKTLGMNSVILDTKYNEKVLFASDVLSSVVSDLDYIGYLVEQARALGLYVYATYDVTDLADSQKTYYRAATIDGATLDMVLKAAADFAARYQFDGILLSNYYTATSGQSYAAYLMSGGGMGFEAYTKQVPRALLGTVAQLIRRVTPATQVGLLSDGVWANSTQNADGTKTTASFTALGSGNADTRAMLLEGLFDFVLVKNYGATGDPNEPFGEVAAWWADLGASTGTTVYMLHAADRVASKNPGWGAYEQLATQMIALDKLSGVSGSAFNSLQTLVKNPGNAATMMAQYMTGAVNEQYILTQLSMAQPTEAVFSTREPSVTFQGASDPQEPITINGAPVQTDDNGYFSVPMELSAGDNTFVIAHKSKSVTYQIERIVEVVKNVQPAGAINVEGGMEVVITAQAYENAVVTATIGGQTITMSPIEDVEDEELRASGYVLYEGRFTAPAAAASAVQLGTIVVTGMFEGVTNTAQGAAVTVNKIVEVGAGGVVQVTSAYAETFPVNTLTNTSDPSHYPLPKGTIDTTVGQAVVYKSGSKSYTFWKLASGLRVLADDIKAVGMSPPGGNAISRATVSAGGLQTLVKLNTVQKVPYTVSYDGYRISFSFKYTSSVPSTVEVGSNAMFSNAAFSDSTLTLTLKKGGGMMGYNAYYENDSTLVLAFMNPTSSLSGARIVVDAGHGGSDPGASGFYPGLDEREINAQVAGRLASILKSKGASVLVTTQGTTLADRLTAAEAFNPHVMVSIHGNSSARNPSASGTEVYYFYGMSKPLATTAAAQVANALGISNRGAKAGLYYTTRTSQCASILVEMGFVSNQQEYAKLINDTYQSRIASAIANSIAAILKAGNTGSSLGGGGLGSAVQDDDDSSSDQPLTLTNNVSLSEKTVNLNVGGQHRLSVSNTAAAVTWESGNSAVATVDSSGLITAVSAGTAEIRAVVGNRAYACAVTVSGGITSRYTITGNARFAVGQRSAFSLSPAFDGNVEWWIQDGAYVELFDSDNRSCVLQGDLEGNTVLFALDGDSDEILAQINLEITS